MKAMSHEWESSCVSFGLSAGGVGRVPRQVGFVGDFPLRQVGWEAWGKVLKRLACFAASGCQQSCSSHHALVSVNACNHHLGITGICF